MALPLALMIGGGLLSAGGSIADRLRERRQSRRAIADLEPYTDPLQGFAQSRGILEAMNQMGTGNLAQLATRMGGSVGAAQAAGAGMGAQSLSNAYLGALETGRERAFQAQAMQNQLRDTKSLLGGAMRDIGGIGLDVGMRMFGQPRTSQELMSTAAPTDYIPEADELDLTMLDVERPTLTRMEPRAGAALTPNIPSAAQALPSLNMSPISGGGGFGIAAAPAPQRVPYNPIISPITMRRNMSMLDPRLGQTGRTMAQTGMLGALAGTSTYQGMGLGQIPLRTFSPPSSIPIQNIIGFDSSAYFPQMIR